MDKKKKVIIGISGNLLTDQRMQRIADALAESGRNVCLYYRQYFKYRDKSDIHHPEYRYETKALNCLFRSGPMFYLEFNIRLFFLILFQKCELLYAVDSDTLPAFILLSKLKRTDMLYDAHEYFAEVPELQYSAFKKKIWHRITQIGVRQSKYNLTVGPLLAKELEKVYGKPFVSLRNVPYLSNYEHTETADRKCILYQGALNEGRMLEMLIEAMRDLPDYHCILAGEGDLSAALRKQAEGLSNVEFKGLMTPQELRMLTPQCYAGFNLLDAGNSKSYFYSLSNKYFDYMMAGVPSISSRLPEYVYLNKTWNCGVCIDNNKEAFIELLKSWETDRGLYAKMKENAKFAVDSNHWEKEKTVLTGLIRS